MALLANKVVCITGASRGIGRACALETAKYGATGLILHYFGDKETESEMQSLKQEVEKINPKAKVVSVPGDISDSATSSKVRDMSSCEWTSSRTPSYRLWRKA